MIPHPSSISSKPLYFINYNKKKSFKSIIIALLFLISKSTQQVINHESEVDSSYYYRYYYDHLLYQQPEEKEDQGLVRKRKLLDVPTEKYSRQNASSCHITAQISCKTKTKKPCESLIVPMEQCGTRKLDFIFKYCNQVNYVSTVSSESFLKVLGSSVLDVNIKSAYGAFLDKKVCYTKVKTVEMNTCKSKIFAYAQIGGYVHATEKYCQVATKYEYEIIRNSPNAKPTLSPSHKNVSKPTHNPTQMPSMHSTSNPSKTPTNEPSSKPSTNMKHTNDDKENDDDINYSTVSLNQKPTPEQWGIPTSIRSLLIALIVLIVLSSLIGIALFLRNRNREKQSTTVTTGGAIDDHRGNSNSGEVSSVMS